METSIINRKEFPLLNRERINIEVVFTNQATPKKEDIKKSVAGTLKADENLISIKHIYSKFGESKAKIIVNLYNDAETFKKFENKKEKQVKAAGKPASE